MLEVLVPVLVQVEWVRCPAKVLADVSDKEGGSGSGSGSGVQGNFWAGAALDVKLEGASGGLRNFGERFWQVTYRHEFNMECF